MRSPRIASACAQGCAGLAVKILALMMMVSGAAPAQPAISEPGRSGRRDHRLSGHDASEGKVDEVERRRAAQREDGRQHHAAQQRLRGDARPVDCGFGRVDGRRQVGTAGTRPTDPESTAAANRGHEQEQIEPGRSAELASTPTASAADRATVAASSVSRKISQPMQVSTNIAGDLQRAQPTLGFALRASGDKADLPHARRPAARRDTRPTTRSSSSRRARGPTPGT